MTFQDHPSSSRACSSARASVLYSTVLKLYWLCYELIRVDGSTRWTGQKIVVRSGDRSVRIWDAATGECVRTLDGHPRAVFSVQFSPDGQRIVSEVGIAVFAS
jgi:WD40 repeat protein